MGRSHKLLHEKEKKRKVELPLNLKLPPATVGAIGENMAMQILCGEGFEVLHMPHVMVYCVNKLAREKVLSFLGKSVDKFDKYLQSGKVSDLSFTYAYWPDIVAKKNGEIYVIEVKTNTGRIDKEEEKKGLMRAKDYGFIPMLIKLYVSIKVTDFAKEILSS